MDSKTWEARGDQPRSVSIGGLPKSPLTGFDRVRCVAKMPSQQLINDWQKRFGIDITAEMKGISEIGCYRCLDTGLLFFWPPSLEGSARLYAQLQEIDWYYGSGDWQHDFAARQLGREDVVLEIGCATGDFLDRIRTLVADAAGIDISETAVAKARARGLPAHGASLREWVTEHPEQATVCCAFQVLEHVSYPKEFIELCIRAVGPKGRLIFATPNARGYLRHQYDILDLPPHHMSRWDIATYRSLEKIFPLRLSRYGIEPLRDSLAELWAKSAACALARFLPEEFVLRAARKLARSPMQRFLTGHTICVVFEKT